MYSCSIWKASSAADTGTEFKKGKYRAALMDIENVRRFVEEKGIDSFEALETFAVQQEASKKEAEEICNRDGREIRRLKELSEAYAAYAPYIPIRNEYLQKKGIAQAVYHSSIRKNWKRRKNSVFRSMNFFGKEKNSHRKSGKHRSKS